METKTKEELVAIIEGLQQEVENLKKEKSDWIGYYNQEVNKVAKMKEIIVSMSSVL